MIKYILTVFALVLSLNAHSAEVPIRGIVTSKCVINTDTAGVYGNPTPTKLSTARADGGIAPVIRFDVVESGYYKATVTVPTAFTSSPTLNDTTAWAGDVVVSKVADAAMSAYTTNKRTYNSTSEFDLTIPGTVWFTVNSRATYGYNKSFPAGEYKSVVLAECIAL